MRALIGPVAVVLLAAAAAAATAAGADERDGPLPRLEQLGPASPAPGDGELEISPAVTEVVVPPDRRVEVRHVVANGLGQPLHLDVEVVAADLDRDGPTVGALAVEPPDAVRLVAPAERLRLEPGEGAALLSTAQADAGQAGLLALTATAPDGSVAAAYVVVSADDRPAAPELDLVLEADGRASVTARAARPTVLDVRLRARGWVGATSDQTAVRLLVGEEPRTLPVAAPAARLPGPVTAVATATGTGDEPVVARDERFVWPPASWLLLAVGVLGAVLLAVVWRGRGRRTGHPTGP